MSDLATTQVFSNGEQNITATKMNNIVGQASIQTSFVAGQPLASSVAPNDQMLLLTAAGGTYARTNFSTITSAVSGSLTPAGVGQAGVMNALSGKTTDYVSGNNTCIDLTSAPAITLMRLRSFNAVGNPTFEVDQRNCGTGVINPTNFVQDRWLVYKSGTMTCTAQQIDAGKTVGGGVPLPGTNFIISNALHRIVLTGQQVSLGSTDQLTLYQNPEGPQFRELSFDVHSVSILARSSVANLKFGCTVKDPGGTRALTKLCTLGTALTWQLITLPNLPVFPSSGNFSTAPGVQGYQIQIQLAGGSSLVTPANDTWQNGAFSTAIGQDNFASKPVNSYIDIAFVQHEPGPNCTTLIDCPFTMNLDQCLRYFQKSYSYSQAVATTNSTSYATFYYPLGASGAFNLYGSVRFPEIMAKLPTVVPYNHVTGASNNAFMWYATSGTLPTATTNQSISGAVASQSGISAISTSGTSTSPLTALAEWTADTGW